MPNPTVRAPRVKPKSQPAARPAKKKQPPIPPTGSARWLFRPAGPHQAGCLRITVQTQAGPVTETYLFRKIEGGYALLKEDGTLYHIDTTDEFLSTCNCPDYSHRKAGTCVGCKHVLGTKVALLALRQRQK